jgi:HSP20 family protein
MSMSYLRPLSDVREQMDRLFTDLAEETRFPSVFNREWPTGLIRNSTWMPPIEVSETDMEVKVCVALPGLKPDEINVEMTDNNTLVISGETHKENTIDNAQCHRSEFRYGSFMRTVPLPEYVTADACEADFKNGVLEIHVPKSETTTRKKINVKTTV